jgi:hypothetical protein
MGSRALFRGQPPSVVFLFVPSPVPRRRPIRRAVFTRRATVCCRPIALSLLPCSFLSFVRHVTTVQLFGVAISILGGIRRIGGRRPGVWRYVSLRAHTGIVATAIGCQGITRMALVRCLWLQRVCLLSILNPGPARNDGGRIKELSIESQCDGAPQGLTRVAGSTINCGNFLSAVVSAALTYRNEQNREQPYEALPTTSRPRLLAPYEGSHISHLQHFRIVTASTHIPWPGLLSIR